MPFPRGERLDWARDGRDWPNRPASRFVEAGGVSWHVQVFGAATAPVLLLIHGAGSATHSWRALAPALAKHFRVVAPDLPGHAFTDPLPARPPALSGMAEALADLTRALDVAPAIVAGHAAGAALLARMCLDDAIDPRLFVAVNGALRPAPGGGFGPLRKLARAVMLAPPTPRVLAWIAGRAVARRLADAMGTRLDERGHAIYRRLLSNPGHVAGTLAMMADWDLAALDRDLPGLMPPALLVVGGNDRAILPATSLAVRDRLRDARAETLPGLGHLAHEEAPERVAALVLREAERLGILKPDA